MQGRSGGGGFTGGICPPSFSQKDKAKHNNILSNSYCNFSTKSCFSSP